MFTKDFVLLMGVGALETLYMILGSTLFAYVLGLPVGIILVATDDNGITPVKWLNRILGFIVNVLRSIPFIILLLWMIPVTRAIIGTTLGVTATIVPLIASAAPFVARMVESSIKEIDGGVIEAAQSMGATPWQIITRVMLPEAKPSLVLGAAIVTTTILGYTAMSGFVGGGGLSTIAINYGYYRYQGDVMSVTVVFLVIIVQIFQTIGMRVAKKIDKR